MSVAASVLLDFKESQDRVALVKSQPVTWARTDDDGLYLYRGHELVGFVPNEKCISLARDALIGLPR